MIFASDKCAECGQQVSELLINYTHRWSVLFSSLARNEYHGEYVISTSIQVHNKRFPRVHARMPARVSSRARPRSPMRVCACVPSVNRLRVAACCTIFRIRSLRAVRVFAVSLFCFYCELKNAPTLLFAVVQSSPVTYSIITALLREPSERASCPFSVVRRHLPVFARDVRRVNSRYSDTFL